MTNFEYLREDDVAVFKHGSYDEQERIINRSLNLLERKFY